jgi:hypothetical protein
MQYQMDSLCGQVAALGEDERVLLSNNITAIFGERIKICNY